MTAAIIARNELGGDGEWARLAPPQTPGSPPNSNRSACQPSLLADVAFTGDWRLVSRQR